MEERGRAAEAATELRVRAVTGLEGIGAAEWDACATSPETLGAGDGAHPSSATPSSALEDGSVSRTGWLPQHARCATRPAIAGCAPCYPKSHSQGEYVFDYGWADAFERAGGSYYPKLQVAPAVQPVTGPRLLVAAGRRDAARRRWPRGWCSLRPARPLLGPRHLLPGGRVARARGVPAGCSAPASSSTGTTTAMRPSTISSARWPRASARRSARAARCAGLRLRDRDADRRARSPRSTGTPSTASTGHRPKWGRPYLNRRFFSLLGERMADKVLLMVAERDGALIAGALNLHRRGRALRPQLGQRRGRIPSCISSSATIRPSTSPSRTG